MPTEPNCRAVRRRLGEDFLARRQPAEEVLAHLTMCSRCAARRGALLALTELLDRAPGRELRPEFAAAVRRRVGAELRGAAAARPTAAARAPLPSGYRGELARLLGWAVLPLPLVLLGYAAIFRLGGALLAEILPGFAVAAIGCAFAIGSASWLALIFGSLPIVAHQRVSNREREVTP